MCASLRLRWPTRRWLCHCRLSALLFFFQADDGIRDKLVTEFRRVLFRSSLLASKLPSFKLVRSQNFLGGCPLDAWRSHQVEAGQLGSEERLGICRRLRGSDACHVEIGRASCRERV